MATQVQFRRGTATQNNSFTGAAGEISINTTNDSIRVHDGSTQGGAELAKADLSNHASVGVLTATTFSGNLTGNVTGNTSGTAGGLSGTPDITVGTVTAATLDISGNVDVDGTLEADAITIDGTSLAETISDTVGAMVSSNTETNITVTYDDSDNTLDFVIGTLNQDTTGNAGTATSLATARTLSVSGAGTGSVSFDGSADADIALTLANSGVTANTYGSSSAIPIVTVDAKGLITSATTTSIDSTTISNGSASVAVAADGPITSNANHDFSAGIDVTGNITVSGTVDGRDVATDGTKLDGIEASADVTDATNVAAAGAVMEGDTTTASMSFVVDEDDMTSNSATKVPTQQSVKAYVDAEVSGVVDSAPGALNTLNELAAALGDDANFSTTVTNSIAAKLPLAGGTMTGNIVMSGSQTVDGRDLSVDGAKLDGIAAGAQVNVATNLGKTTTTTTNVITSSTGTNATLNEATSSAAGLMSTTHHDKLDGIESGATADQTASEILTLIKTVDGSGSGLDADTLDSVSSGSFLRSDAADQKTSGTLRFNDNIILSLGSGDDAEFFCNGSHFYLDLNSGIGNFYIRDGSTTRFTFDDAGHFTATGDINSSSDIRLKTNIKTLTNSLDKVLQMRGVEYDRIDLDGKHQIGVIAQEVEEVAPELVSSSDDDGMKSVSYGNITAILIEAIKEQQKQIEELKKRLDK